MEKVRTQITTFEVTKGKVTIGDPCYDDLGEYHCYEFKNGVYNCTLYQADRNLSITILLEGQQEYTKTEVSSCAVDSGTIGFFDGIKPSYPDEEWNKLVEILSDPDYDLYEGDEKNAFKCNAVCCVSGWGDGMYPLYLLKSSTGETIGAEILF